MPLPQADPRVQAILDRIADPTTTAKDLTLLKKKLKALSGGK